MNIAQRNPVAVLIVVAACAVVTAVPVSASPVILGGSGSWNAWGPSPSLNTAAARVAPFWNNTSYDRNGLADIGYFMSGTPGSDVPGFYTNSPGQYLPYLGDGSTTFAVSITDPTDFTHLLSVTGWSTPGGPDDEFGLMNLASGEHYSLFNASASMGYMASFNSGGLYAFYLRSGEGRTWYSTSLDGGLNHFALFQGEHDWYLGVEDATYTTRRTADWDYNDVVVKWAAQPVPEFVPEPVPDGGSTSMLAALALLSLGAARRRWLP
jgi:hypothetical protein